MGIYCFEAEEVPLKAPSLMSQVSGLRYTLHANGADADALAARIADLLSSERIGVERKLKAKKQKKGRGRRPAAARTAEVNLRPMIEELSVRETPESETVIDFATIAHDQKLAKPREILALLGLDVAATRIVKRETLLADSLATA
jgi:hypothetical protein